MPLLDRLTRIESEAQARRLTLVYGVAATVVSAAASAVLSIPLRQPMLVEAFSGAVIAAVLAPAMTWPLAKAAVALSARERALALQANTDAMTGALNRRGFFAAAQPMLERRAAAPLCAMLVDLDRFKEINDTYGHAAGDEVVIAAAHAIAAVAAPHRGLVGRIGGDEFCILFADVDEKAASALAERLRGEIETRIVRSGDRAIRISASIGAATSPAGLSTTLDELLARADAYLYAAKTQGRNRAVADDAVVRKRA